MIEQDNVLYLEIEDVVAIYAELSLQAAALAHSIAEGQYFIDGNKRTALEALRVFLLANGYTLTATQVERHEWMLGSSPSYSRSSTRCPSRRSALKASPA